MKYKIKMDFPKIKTIDLELDDTISPNTVKTFLNCLPIKVSINLWGDELYTGETHISAQEENSQPVVALMDVAYWPPGKAICLFFGPTPISDKNEIRPYSPVNIIGKIKDEDKNFLKDLSDGMMVTFRLA